MTRARRGTIAGVLLLLIARADVRPTSAAAVDTVHVRASAAFAHCLAPALDAFTRATGIGVALTIADPDPPEDADVVVGDDLEMTRLLEGGAAELSTARDLGQIPWVTVVPVGSAADAVSALATGPVAVLGGRAGREARESLGSRAGLGAGQVALATDAAVLRSARLALVPRSLAGDGERRPARVRPLVATAASIAGSPRKAAAGQLLAFLASHDGARALGPCFDPMPAPEARAAAVTAGTSAFAQSVVDWWLPQCTLDHNRYNDPQEVLGPPDAVNLDGVDNYRGFMSLGEGGYVTVDMGSSFVDGPGPDVRVYQTTAGEPVTLYASASPNGPFTLVGLRVPCGERSGGGIFSHHCDFDLHDAGLASARYLKVEDGETYPCLAGATDTEGPDIDAIEILSARN